METHKCFFEDPHKTPCNDLYGQKKCDAGIRKKEACAQYTKTVKSLNKQFKSLPKIPLFQLVRESLELAFKTK